MKQPPSLLLDAEYAATGGERRDGAGKEKQQVHLDWFIKLSTAADKEHGMRDGKERVLPQIT